MIEAGDYIVTGDYIVAEIGGYRLFCGYLLARNGDEMALENCREIVSGIPAGGPVELAANGPGEGSKLSCKCECVWITGVRLTARCSPEATQALKQWPAMNL